MSGPDLIRIYGIKQCDTCRKALKWLEGEGRAFEWQDLREQPLSPEQLATWVEQIGPDTLVNRRSTTWRQLTEAERAKAMDATQVAELLGAHPTLIKRPVFRAGDRWLVGFNEAVRDSL